MLILIGLALAGWRFLEDNPQHNPWALLDLRDPPGWATERKLVNMRSDIASCRAVLERSDVRFDALKPQGEGACARPDRTVLASYPYVGRRPATTCALGAGLTIWLEQSVQPAATEIFGSSVTGVRHLGAFSCRRMYGSDTGPWSEHATGNALDVAGFRLADGTEITVLRDWDDGEKGEFLKRIRDEACPIFGTVLSPAYNAAHRDHFHFDQADRNWGVCR